MGSSQNDAQRPGQFHPGAFASAQLSARSGRCRKPRRACSIVVDTESAGQAALLVDNISDQRQFVIKSLETHYRPVEGVAGATILGDGRVALILDVDGLVALRAARCTRGRQHERCAGTLTEMSPASARRSTARKDFKAVARDRARSGGIVCRPAKRCWSIRGWRHWCARQDRGPSADTRTASAAISRIGTRRGWR